MPRLLASGLGAPCTSIPNRRPTKCFPSLFESGAIPTGRSLQHLQRFSMCHPPLFVFLVVCCIVLLLTVSPLLKVHMMVSKTRFNPFCIKTSAKVQLASQPRAAKLSRRTGKYINLPTPVSRHPSAMSSTPAKTRKYIRPS